MNTLKSNIGCLSCSDGCDPCKKKCGPAAYGQNAAKNSTACDCPQETDTSLSIDYSGATLNYKAERHTDIITGEQLGSIINVGDLRDTKVDYSTEAMCYELIYHKYGDCGEGCKSIEDVWSTFSIDNENALGPQIRYVRGANRYGCPYFLDVPTNTSQYWFQGWRGDSNENGYYQAVPVDELPKDSKGDYYVMSQYPSNKQPVIGILPWQCMMDNIFGNLGIDVSGVWRAVQGTAGFGDNVQFDQINGYFSVNWNDWNDLAETQLAGRGVISGKVNWSVSFDTKTGNLKYVINNIYYDKMTWTPEQGVTAASAPRMSLDAINPATGAKTTLIPEPGVEFGKTTVNYPINKTLQINQTIIISPGGSAGPMDFLYIYVDWVHDDKGYLGMKFGSRLSGYKQC